MHAIYFCIRVSGFDYIYFPQPIYYLLRGILWTAIGKIPTEMERIYIYIPYCYIPVNEQI
jgi:hypothetical protein